METAHQAALHHAWDSVWADEWRGRDGLIVDDEHRITGAEAPDQTPRVAQAANDGAGRRAGAHDRICKNTCCITLRIDAMPTGAC